jgi:signal transduction histidine kinase
LQQLQRRLAWEAPPKLLSPLLWITTAALISLGWFFPHASSTSQAGQMLSAIVSPAGYSTHFLSLSLHLLVSVLAGGYAVAVLVAGMLDRYDERSDGINLQSGAVAALEHAVMLARQRALSKPIKIELYKAPELEVEHDSDQVHPVLLNLLLNAVQAVTGAGTVRVEIGSREGFAIVLVSDNGRGISPPPISNIFRPFYTTKGNGTGLGFSLARRIVEEHHGRIEVSKAFGQGSQFTVLLPFHVPTPQIAVPTTPS